MLICDITSSVSLAQVSLIIPMVDGLLHCNNKTGIILYKRQEMSRATHEIW